MKPISLIQQLEDNQKNDVEAYFLLLKSLKVSDLNFKSS